MYYKSRLTGLMPNTLYRAGFVLGLATNAPRGCTGVGGAPGESVYLKAGVSAVEPVAILAGDGHLRMNIDKGNQSNGGAALERHGSATSMGCTSAGSSAC